MSKGFLPCMEANQRGFSQAQAETSLTMNGQFSQQKTVKYPAMTVGELRRK